MRAILWLTVVALVLVTANGCIEKVDENLPSQPLAPTPIVQPGVTPVPTPAPEPQLITPIPKDLGPAPIELDATVAGALAAEAGKFITENDVDKATLALNQLGETLQCMRAEIPARQMVQYLQRARALIDEGDMEGGSRELRRTQEVYLTGRPASLVPDVLKDVGDAKKKVDSGDPAGCNAAVDALITKLRGTSQPDKDPYIKLTKAIASVANTREATARGAFKVAQAELAYLNDLLQALPPKPAAEATAEPAPADTTQPATPTTAQPPAAPAEGSAAEATAAPAPAAPAPAAGVGTAAPGETPATAAPGTAAPSGPATPSAGE